MSAHDFVFSPASRATLIVPCFNEAGRLDVPAFRRFLSGPGSARLLFVDDGSSDLTFDVLQTIRAEFPDTVSVLRLEVNGGKAEAVRRGLLHAARVLPGEYAGFWDADLATPLDTIPRFIATLDARPGIQMVFGSRVQLLGRHVVRRASRHYLGRVFATFVSLMLRLPIYDTQCGAKLFRVDDTFLQVFAEPFLSRWIFDVEIIARYELYGINRARLHNAIYEYPLETWTDIAGSKLRSTDFFRALFDLLRIYRRYFMGAHRIGALAPKPAAPRAKM